MSLWLSALNSTAASLFCCCSCQLVASISDSRHHHGLTFECIRVKDQQFCPDVPAPLLAAGVPQRQKQEMIKWMSRWTEQFGSE